MANFFSDHPWRYIMTTAVAVGGLLIAYNTYQHNVTKDDAAEADKKAVHEEKRAQAQHAEFKEARAILVDAKASQSAHTEAAEDLQNIAQENPEYASDVVSAFEAALHEWTPVGESWDDFSSPIPSEALYTAGFLRNLLRDYDTGPGPEFTLSMDNLDLHGQSWAWMRLDDTYAVHTDLRRANLTGAQLQGATLTDSSLACANLAGASLEGAHVVGVALNGADLAGADMRVDGDLTADQLAGAHWDDSTVWAVGPPEGMEPTRYLPDVCQAALDERAADD